MSKAYRQDVPYNKLFKSAKNVRRTGLRSAAYRKGIEELAASIYNTHQRTGQGLLQNLIVHPVDEGFGVNAGGRRFDAIGLLVEQGKFPSDYPCECLVIGAEDATNTSLAENTQRKSMHPADELDAFMELTEQGWTLDQIADDFGVSTLVVERRLKLRAAAPALLADFREGLITTDQLIGLCATDNHELQVEVWSRVRDQHYGKDPVSLRRAVTSTEVEASEDLRVQFIGGVDAYEQAGGAVRRDLFSDDGKGVMLADSALLETLVLKKVEEQAEAVRLEGWSWLEVWPQFEWTQMDRFGRAPKTTSPLSAETEEKLALLKAELAEVQKTMEGVSGDDDSDEASQLSAREDQLVLEIDNIQESQVGYSSAVMGYAGAVLCYQRGAVRIERGLVRASDRANVAALLDEGQSIHGGRESEPAGRKADTLTDALRSSLLAHRNLGAQFATAANPKAAKILLVCKFVTDARRNYNVVPTDMSISSGYGTRTGCKITDEQGLLKETSFEAQVDEAIAALPTDPVELWDKLAEMTDIELDALLAHSVAQSVSLSEKLSGLSEKYLSVLGFNMADHFTTTAVNYLGRVSKEMILEALTEAGKVSDDNDRAALLGMKKGALAKEAESRLAGTSWVPSLIRTAVVSVAKKPNRAKKEKAADKA